MSEVLHRLAGLGLDVRGVPPTMAVVVQVGGREVSVTCDASDERALRLVAETAGPGGQPDDALLAAAARTAAGDTAFGVRGDQLTATRHLVDPSPGAAYDALFELAKGVVALRLALEAAVAPAAAALASAAPPAVDAAPTGPPHAQPPAASGPPHANGPTPGARVAVGAAGLAAYEAPDPARPPVAMLSPGLPVVVVAINGQWAHVRADNGWTGWVDAAGL